MPVLLNRNKDEAIQYDTQSTNARRHDDTFEPTTRGRAETSAIGAIHERVKVVRKQFLLIRGKKSKGFLGCHMYRGGQEYAEKGAESQFSARTPKPQGGSSEIFRESGRSLEAETYSSIGVTYYPR